jgi:biopolymer transport protein ExbB
MNAFELFDKGGPVMWPLLFLSILAIATIIERLWFWISLLAKEREIVHRVVDAGSSQQWELATQLAKQERQKPIGRFLYAPLKRDNPDPETFKLALEAAASDEISLMRRGDKILESVIAISPLLGLLGTVLGLIRSLNGIKLGDLGTSAANNVTLGLSESLISTAAGMIVAIFSLAFYRVFQGLISNQIRVFQNSGNELELSYRSRWDRVKTPNVDEETELM